MHQSKSLFQLYENNHGLFVYLFVYFLSLFLFCICDNLSRANVNGKDISLYENTKSKLATSSSMKKPDFKAAIDQIELALSGKDPAPNSYEVNLAFFLSFDFQKFMHIFLQKKIPLDKSNATFDNTLNSTIETTDVGSNSTKVDESTVYDDIDDAEVESDTKDEPAETTVDDNDIVTESTEINNSNNMVK